MSSISRSESVKGEPSAYTPPRAGSTHQVGSGGVTEKIEKFGGRGFFQSPLKHSNSERSLRNRRPHLRSRATLAFGKKEAAPRPQRHTLSSSSLPQAKLTYEHWTLEDLVKVYFQLPPERLLLVKLQIAKHLLTRARNLEVSIEKAAVEKKYMSPVKKGRPTVKVGRASVHSMQPIVKGTRAVTPSWKNYEMLLNIAKASFRSGNIESTKNLVKRAKEEVRKIDPWMARPCLYKIVKFEARYDPESALLTLKHEKEVVELSRDPGAIQEELKALKETEKTILEFEKYIESLQPAQENAQKMSGLFADPKTRKQCESVARAYRGAISATGQLDRQIAEKKQVVRERISQLESKVSELTVMTPWHITYTLSRIEEVEKAVFRRREAAQRGDQLEAKLIRKFEKLTSKLEELKGLSGKCKKQSDQLQFLLDIAGIEIMLDEGRFRSTLTDALNTAKTISSTHHRIFVTGRIRAFESTLPPFHRKLSLLSSSELIQNLFSDF